MTAYIQYKEEISNKLHTYNLTYKDYLNKVMY